MSIHDLRGDSEGAICPARNIKLGEDIPLESLPADIYMKYIEIIISHVISPDEFYFCLETHSSSLIRLEELMNKIICDHQQADGDCIVPSTDFKTGQICVALYNQQTWHRARIIDVFAEEYSVFFIDYGSFCNVTKSEVRPLRTLFSSLPAQAHAAKLWNIRCHGEEWSLEGRDFFFDRVANKSVGAKIIGTKFNQKLEVKVSGLHIIDIYKNDWDIGVCVVDKGYGCYFDEYEEMKTRSPSKTKKSKSRTRKTKMSFKHSVSQEQTSDETKSPKKCDVTFEESKTEKQLQTCNVLENGDIKRYVKMVKLCEFKVHLILHNRELYTASKDISQFFWDRDLLRIKLRLNNFKVDQPIINENEYSELFKELLSYKLCNEPLEDGLPYAMMIYPFSRLPDIIDKFNPKLIDLKKAVIEELDKFDPNDAYWWYSDEGIREGRPLKRVDEVEIGLQVLKNRKTAITRELKIGSKKSLLDELSYLNERILFLEIDESK